MARNTIHNELATMEPGDISNIIDSLMQLHSLGKCATNKELRERIQLYFQFCKSKSFRPGVESLATALCIHRNTMYQWSKGKNCDSERTEIINDALQVIHAFLEQSGLSGKLSPPSYIFLSKVWMGYRETAPISDYRQDQEENKTFDVNALAERLGINNFDVED